MCIAEGDGTKGNTSRLSHEVFHRNSHVFLQERTFRYNEAFHHDSLGCSLIRNKEADISIIMQDEKTESLRDGI